MTPAEIAARLTDAQKRALLWLDSGKEWKTQERGKHQVSLWAMRSVHTGDPERKACWKYCLVRHTPHINTPTQWRLTPLGRQVRAILAAEAQRDG